jgi:hypothetical protein
VSRRAPECYRRRRMRGLAVAMVLAAGAAAEAAKPSASTPCIEPRSVYQQNVLVRLSAFDVILKQAAGAERGKIGREIEGLRNVRAKTAELDPPACAGEFQTHVLRAMDLEIGSLEKFRRLEGAELRRFAAAPDAKKKEILGRTRAEYAWKLVLFELDILQRRSSLRPADSPPAHPR